MCVWGIGNISKELQTNQEIFLKSGGTTGLLREQRAHPHTRRTRESRFKATKKEKNVMSFRERRGPLLLIC